MKRVHHTCNDQHEVQQSIRHILILYILDFGPLLHARFYQFSRVLCNLASFQKLRLQLRGKKNLSTGLFLRHILFQEQEYEKILFFCLVF